VGDLPDEGDDHGGDQDEAAERGGLQVDRAPTLVGVPSRGHHADGLAAPADHEDSAERGHDPEHGQPEHRVAADPRGGPHHQAEEQAEAGERPVRAKPAAGGLLVIRCHLHGTPPRPAG
jgi:hypothetical protein